MNQEQEPSIGYGIKRYLQRRRLAATGMSFQIITNVGLLTEVYLRVYSMYIILKHTYNLNLIMFFFTSSAMYFDAVFVIDYNNSRVRFIVMHNT